MTRTLFHGLVAAALALGAGIARAQATPVGVWKTIDDETEKEKSLIRITESGGVLSGKLEKLLDPATAPDAVCKECSDERKDKPMLGMTLHPQCPRRTTATRASGTAATSSTRTTARSTACA